MTDDEIQEALQSQKLDLRMDLDPEDALHQWFQLALDEGRRLCIRSGLPLTFTFNCSPGIQAYALYRHKLIVVSAGCFDFLCRIADRIIAKGIYQGIGMAPRLQWTPPAHDPEETIRSLIAKSPFSPSNAVWLADPERKELFTYLILTLFRFVVLHEIGHFHHRHGIRFTQGADSLDVDSAQPSELAEADAVDSQARELVADKFAGDILARMIEDEAPALAAMSRTRSFANQFLDTRVKRTCFVLQIVYIYFSATDRLPKADPLTSTRMSHPPAPFRLVTLVTTAQTGFASENDRQHIAAFVQVADAVMAVTLDRPPGLEWLAQLEHPAFSTHYNNLYDKVDAWAISPQKAPVSAANPA